MLAGLRAETLDAALMMEPSKQAAPGVAFDALQRFPVGIAVASAHPFARRKSVTIPEALAGPLVAYSRREYPDYHAMVIRRVGTKFKRVNFAEECDSGPSLIAAIQSGRGLCIIPSFVASAAAGRVKFVPLAPDPAPAVLGIAYRQGRIPPLLRALIEAARAIAR